MGVESELNAVRRPTLPKGFSSSSPVRRTPLHRCESLVADKVPEQAWVRKGWVWRRSPRIPILASNDSSCTEERVNRSRVAGLGGLALVLGAANPAGAQLSANPAYASPIAPKGLTLAADFGTTLSTTVTSASGGVTATATNQPNQIGLRAALGSPVISISVGAGRYNNDSGGDKAIQFCGNLGLRLFSASRARVAIGLNAGAGYVRYRTGAALTDPETKAVSLPVGLGVAVKPRSRRLPFELWASPRIQVNVLTVGGSRRAQAGVGGSAGVNVAMLKRLGLHVAADWVRMSAKASGGPGSLVLPESQTLVLGLGMHYTFTLSARPVVQVD